MPHLHSWKKNFQSSETSSTSTFLRLLLAGDGAFLFLHFLRVVFFFDNRLLSLEWDNGYSEIYQYVKEFWIAYLLFSMMVKYKKAGYGIWALLFSYFLADDALQVHEKGGAYLATKLGFMPIPLLKARTSDFGEIAVSATVALVFIALLALFYTGGNRTFKRVSQQLGIGVIALAFFGVFLDFVHIVVLMYFGRGAGFLMGTIEDFGEMIVMSFIVWYAFIQYSERNIREI